MSSGTENRHGVRKWQAALRVSANAVLGAQKHLWMIRAVGKQQWLNVVRPFWADPTPRAMPGSAWHICHSGGFSCLTYRALSSQQIKRETTIIPPCFWFRVEV